jgi:hypothetical protein
MWIIPKTLSAFVPDTEGLNLDLDERAWILESSAMWRSKPSSKPTWLRRLKKGGWITRLSTRILKPSLHQSFEEKYTDSLEDIHVSPSVQQGSEKAKTTQDTYGHISESTSGQLDLFGAFSKMSEVTPRWGYGESCPIWKKMVTERSGDCSARRKQARLTNASDASSLGGWATPMSGTKDHMSSSVEYYQRRQKIGKQVDLNGQVILDKWATPQASDHVEGARTAKESNQKCLGRDLNQMENWPTPRAGNPGSRKPGTGGKILAEEAKKNWRTPSVAEVQNQCNSTQIYLQNQVGATEKKGKNWEQTQWPARPGEEQYEWEEPRVTEAQSELGGAVDGLSTSGGQT